MRSSHDSEGLEKPSNVILIVDDTIENLRLLGEMLEGEGHAIRVANNGQQALDLARNQTIDLVLLDIMMPVMDGYEVCRRLKSNDQTANIPVIFLSALNDEVDEGKGLDLGAVDYITKPFKVKLVQKRINHHLALHRLQMELSRNAEVLEQVVQNRTMQLAETMNRLQISDMAKGLYLRLIFQEIQAPANGLIGISQLALNEIQDPAKQRRLQLVFDSVKLQLDTTVANSLKLAQLQSEDYQSSLRPVKIAEVLAKAKRDLADQYALKKIKPGEAGDNSLIAYGDADLLLQALSAFMAMLILESQEEAQIQESFRETNESILLEFRVSQCLEGFRPISQPDGLASLVDKRDTLKPIGLRLVLAGAIIQALHGNFLLKAQPKTGLVLEITLPKYR